MCSHGLKDFREGRILLLMIDHATRLSVTKIVPSKKTERIANAIMKYCVAVYSSDNKFLTDNGRKFVNDRLLRLCEAVSIRLQTAGAESPWFQRTCWKTQFSIVRNFEQSFRKKSLLPLCCTCMVFKSEKFIAKCSWFFTLLTYDWTNSITPLYFQWQTTSNV